MMKREFQYEMVFSMKNYPLRRGTSTEDGSYSAAIFSNDLIVLPFFPMKASLGMNIITT